MLISQLEKEVEQRIIKKRIVPNNDPNGTIEQVVFFEEIP